LIDGPINVPLILVFEFAAGAVVAGACVAGACVAGACVAGAVATVFVPELFVATGLAFFVAAAVTFVVAAADEDGDDEADALDVAPGPVTGPPAMLIALVVPN
jgi:hypothetical protein